VRVPEAVEMLQTSAGEDEALRELRRGIGHLAKTVDALLLARDVGMAISDLEPFRLSAERVHADVAKYLELAGSAGSGVARATV
jgi:hypothetical protein